MNATAPTIDIYTLPLTAMLSTEQVASLGLFGTKATLEHNRSVGRPGPKHLKICGRIYYRVADLLTFVALQEAESERQIEERRARFEKSVRGSAARMAELANSPAGRAAADAADRAARSAMGNAVQAAGIDPAAKAARARRSA